MEFSRVLIPRDLRVLLGQPDQRVQGAAARRQLGEFTATIISAMNQPARQALYSDARRLLELLYSLYLETGTRERTFYIDGEEDEDLATMRLSYDGARKAIEVLRSKGLLDTRGADYVAISELGVDAAENATLLEELLPIGGTTTRDTTTIPVAFDVGDMERSLEFLADQALRAMLGRDLRELQLALDCGMIKTTILLCGSILEAILLDVVARRSDLAMSYRPKKKNFPADFALTDFLEIVVGEQLVAANVAQMATCVVEHRDLIHPAAERRQNQSIDPARAGAMVAFLRVVVHDLMRAAAEGTLDLYVKK